MLPRCSPFRLGGWGGRNTRGNKEREGLVSFWNLLLCLGCVCAGAIYFFSLFSRSSDSHHPPVKNRLSAVPACCAAVVGRALKGQASLVGMMLLPFSVAAFSCLGPESREMSKGRGGFRGQGVVCLCLCENRCGERTRLLDVASCGSTVS